ncbi:Hsp70 family ATPase SSQ1 [Lachancea thermotolerans CBS 6340]|uniref:KLTH0D13530p n=1 Tax=Lachancea thermotolerans (strain ATCC 56472 / CBS 6340 / NRRL Y-8284) TaxID=559295 RepID=C5DFA5_LACTC|nr:KLTH0D13530p [Lachancea thermotolerans CBS 6340]CAR22860.1 KLTH0D13530p [Lachancea thermotolerans CBS 6340]
MTVIGRVVQFRMFRVAARVKTNALLSPLNKRFASSKVIGIDLGTTNSAVAYIRDPLDLNSVTIIENDEGKRTTPSVVAYDAKSEKILVGDAAKRQALINAGNTFYATKRLIGRPFQDKEIQKDIEHLPYKVVENPTNHQAYLSTATGEVKSPSEIGSAILNYLKKNAENYLNEEINKAVITVPAYFNDSQRQATKDAGSMAGLKVLRVVNEPTAAALSFGLDTKEYSGIIAVYDLGGGTFDISILDIEGGVFEVRATNGDTHLGGEDFDNILVRHVVDKFVEANPELEKDDLLHNREFMQRIRIASEKAKIDLSHVKETSIDIPFVYQSKHVKLVVKEHELDDMTMSLINKTIPPVKRALKDAEIEPEEVDEVILVGGMTRMPKIRSVVTETFGKKPNTSVNPDETVALGAAIQGGVLSGEIKNVLLLDVTPLTLGIETYGGAFSPLIPRNTTVPVKKTEVFSTGVDGQNGVDIRVFQGERGLVKDNKLIGDFKLAGIPPMPKGVPQIEVTFDIDADGIINVSASETSTGKNSSITVIANSGLTEEEIAKMVQEANANKEMDNILRQRVELITKADIMISDTENTFERFKETINKSALFPEVSAQLKDVRDLITKFKSNESDLSTDVNDVKRATDDVQKMALKLFQDASKKNASGN